MVDDPTLRQSQVPPPLQSGETYVLRCTQGESAGAELPLDGGQRSRAIVGQDTSCDVVLTDREASRRHFALDVLEEGELLLSDLGSTNGTWVEGIRVQKVFLRGGERITVGRSELSVVRSQEVKPIPLSGDTHFGRLIGASAGMRRLYPTLHRLAATDVSVLIE